MTVVEVLVTVTHGVDIGLSGQERHQLILSEDEQFLGIAMVYVVVSPNNWTDIFLAFRVRALDRK